MTINGKAKLAVLNIVEQGFGSIVNDDVMKAMRAQGLVEARSILNGKRGRPSLSFHVTPKANSFRNIANKW